MPDGALHANQTGPNLHIPIRYVASSDPSDGTTKAGDWGLNTAGGSGKYELN